jgi:hypothetical protein
MMFNLTIEDSNDGVAGFATKLTLDELNTVMSSLVLTNGHSFVVTQFLEDKQDPVNGVPREKLLADCKTFAAALSGWEALDAMRHCVDAGEVKWDVYNTALHEWFESMPKRYEKAKAKRCNPNT